MNTEIHSSRWFYWFILIHLTAWTLAPALVRFTLPMDSIEGAIWGHQLALGYDKNPFMNAWLTALAIKLGGQSTWCIYFFSQLSVVICFWSIWQLGRKMAQPIFALIAVMLLEAMQYYNLHAIELNDNTLELGLWGLSILFFYQALTEKKWYQWLLTAIFVGLSMMTKYFTAVLMLPMLGFMLVNNSARTQFKNPAFYTAIGVFLIIIIPHVIWLFYHNFITIHYAFNRVSTVPTLFQHFSYPKKFALDQIAVTLPAMLLLITLAYGNKKDAETFTLTKFNKQFLYFVGLGPLLLTLFLSLALGIKLRSGWGQPLLSLFGLLFFLWFNIKINTKSFYRFITAFYIFFALLLAGYCYVLLQGDRHSSGNFPGKIISQTLTKEWNTQFHRPLPYVAGSRWLAGNIAFYSSDRPSVYINWDKNVSFWIDENKIREEGAIFVWDPNEDLQAAPAEIKKRFPNLGNITTRKFSWLRSSAAKPVEFTMAILPPKAVPLSPHPSQL